MTSGHCEVRSPTSTVGVMQAVLTLPSGPLAEAYVSLARTTESLPIVDHSIRSFLYARLLAGHEGSLADAAYDEGLLFAARILHDLGLGTGARGKARLEFEGADLAAAPPPCTVGLEWPPATSTARGRRSRCIPR